tara:strand:- start:175 stop:405 length:231 start_codon:yes stop_codon:yes gene_type:complete
MHDYEEGHDCPRCGKNSICTIEDGFCENQGTCNDCIKETYFDPDDIDYYGEPDWEEDEDDLVDSLNAEPYDKIVEP